MIEGTNAFEIHDLAPQRSRIIVCVVLRSGTRLMRLERIEQRAHALFTFPPTPFGYHMSYHDAGDDHPEGRIHVRLDPRRGIFRVFPEGDTIGHEAAAWNAPAFTNIEGVVPVPPGSLGFVSIDALVAQSPVHRPIKAIDHVIEIGVDALKGGSFGCQLLLVQPDNMTALLDWLAEEENSWRSFGRITIEQVHLYQTFHPWLAVVVASLTH